MECTWPEIRDDIPNRCANFRTGSKAESTGHINPKYGSSPGRTFYTHISDQYAPFSAKVVNVGLRDSTYVLDGLLYHESDLRIEEHYTDTAGFTDHVFGLMGSPQKTEFKVR